MIVCHEHRFIFVHLKRTSGRAITTALAPYLSDDDVVTPVHRTSDDGRPAVPGRNCEGIGRHATALEIRERVGKKIWDSYFTFAMERNPWDKTLSRYFAYLKKGKLYRKLYSTVTRRQMSLEHWLRVRSLNGRLLGPRHTHLPNHFGCYTDENGEQMVDMVARLENREEHLAEIGRRIGLPIETGVKVGTKVRADRGKSYTEFFREPWTQRLIERVFERDLAFLGYRFGEPFPTDWIER